MKILRYETIKILKYKKARSEKEWTQELIYQSQEELA